MKLYYPFIISSRLCPAVRIGDATLSLIHVAHSATKDGRDIAHFVLDFPGDGTGYPVPSYLDTSLKSGCQGFRSTVEIFESFLGFMSACAESWGYEGPDGKRGENADLFPPYIAEWISENEADICNLLCHMTDHQGRLREDLIEE